MRRLPQCAAIALVCATPAIAQDVRDCNTFEANARNTYPPYEETIRSYANGNIRVIALDVGEPAAAAYHLLVTHPLPDEPFPGCSLISNNGSLGFGSLHMDNVAASYDPTAGLSLSIPAEFYEGDAVYVETLRVTVNQATGVVSAVIADGGLVPPPAGSK